jgi:hypothetical protein
MHMYTAQLVSCTRKLLWCTSKLAAVNLQYPQRPQPIWRKVTRLYFSQFLRLCGDASHASRLHTRLFEGMVNACRTHRCNFRRLGH